MRSLGAWLKLRRLRSDPVRAMPAERLRYGSLLATVGAAVLAVSVFLPWYAFSLTSSGLATAQQTVDSLAAQYGNAALQGQARTLTAGFGALAGHQLGTVSGHQALKYINIILLVLAAVAFLAALLRLAGASEPMQLTGGQVALVGAVASVLVGFRIVDPPAQQQEVFTLSASWGIWLALLSSLAIVAGGLWSARPDSPKASGETLADAWDGLSGWTPDH